MILRVSGTRGTRLWEAEGVGSSATEPRSGEVVDNPRRPQGAAGNGDTTTLSEQRSCDVVFTRFGRDIGVAEVWSGRHHRSAVQIFWECGVCPRLSRSAEAPLHRRGLSTTSPLRGSAAVTGLKDSGLFVTRGQ